MNLTYQLIKTEIEKLNKALCADAGASDEGKKFSLLMLKKLSGYKRTKLINYFSDGGGDHQIDGVYFIEDGDEVQINVLSCSFRSNGKAIEDKDVTDLVNNGLPYLFFGEEKVADFSPKIKAIKAEIDEIKDEYQGKYIIVIKFVSISENVLSNHGESAFLRFQSDLQSKNIDIEFEKIGAKQISALFSSRSVLKTPTQIKLSGKSYYPLTGKEGFVCRLPAQEIIKIYFGFSEGEKKYPGYGDFLFEDNVRKNLGLEKKINKDIYATATTKEQALNFEYFNNGLTIIYDDRTGALAGDSPILFFKGLQVVNGCQTVNALIKAYEDSCLSEDIYLTCRFIKRSDDEQFIQSVITYTNSQNAISDRDLHANDRIQYDIQGILRNIGIYYERKLNEHKEQEDSIRIDALDAAQAYLCCVLQEPHRAKQDKRKLFNELYYRIFDKTKSDLAYQLLLSYRAMEFILDKQSGMRGKKRKIKKQGKTPRYRLSDLIVAHGSYHIASMVFKNMMSGVDSGKIEKFAKNFKITKTVEKIYEKALKDLEQHVTLHNISKENLPQYFKSTGSCV
jgi:hypothetical protein